MVADVSLQPPPARSFTPGRAADTVSGPGCGASTAVWSPSLLQRASAPELQRWWAQTALRSDHWSSLSTGFWFVWFPTFPLALTGGESRGEFGPGSGRAPLLGAGESASIGLFCLCLPDPFFPLSFLVNSWFPGMLDDLFQSVFLCALLLFWLCVYHGIRVQVSRQPPALLRESGLSPSVPDPGIILTTNLALRTGLQPHSPQKNTCLWG